MNISCQLLIVFLCGKTKAHQKCGLKNIMGMFQEGVVTLSIGAIGMLGNVIAIPYFGRRILSQKTFYILLLCLSICDLIVVTNGMLLYGIIRHNE